MKKYKQGFTIIEVTVSAFLMVILGISIFALQKVIGDSQLFAFTNYTNVDEANYSVSQMAREIRTMRQGQNGSYPIISGTDNDFSFYSDIDFDGESELVRYWLDGGTLYKSVIDPVGFPAVYPPENAIVRPLSDNVQNGADPLFLYFNDAWPEDSVNNPLPTPVDLAEVRLIRISLNIRSNDNVGTRGYLLNTNVAIRILKDNLQ